MGTHRMRTALGLLLVVGLGFGTAACGSDGDDPAEDGTVTLVINGLPPATEAANHQRFLDNVAEFE